MKTPFLLSGFALFVTVAAATAHTGAAGVVLERMQNMSAMADAMKALAPIARGQVDHDPDVARATAEVLHRHAGAGMVTLFEEGTGAPPSEASANVREHPRRFLDLAEQLQTLAADLSERASDADSTATVFAQIDRTCVACHEGYRVKQP